MADPAAAGFVLTTAVVPGTETDSASTNTHTVFDNVGNSAVAGPVTGNKVDLKAPDISIGSPTSTSYILGQTVASGYSCADSGSGIAGCAGPVSSGDNIATATVGAKTFTVYAQDAVGNTADAAVTYNVIYNWAGFFKPVDNGQVNKVCAGRAIPVKFSLDGDQGLDILASGYPRSYLCDCAGESSDAIEETVTAGKSSLRFKAGAGQYVYVWKTVRAWSDSCRVFEIVLADGTRHQASFEFK